MEKVNAFCLKVKATKKCLSSYSLTRKEFWTIYRGPDKPTNISNQVLILYKSTISLQVTKLKNLQLEGSLSYPV